MGRPKDIPLGLERLEFPCLRDSRLANDVSDTNAEQVTDVKYVSGRMNL